MQRYSFTADQIQRILGFIEPASTDKLLGKQVYPSSIWLIDSDASHHMTGPHLEEGDWTGRGSKWGLCLPSSAILICISYRRPCYYLNFFCSTSLTARTSIKCYSFFVSSF
ncbi:hypothetical protein LIER_42503 [Lithospermum erythrorhizon]|uniref:Uncharacterized protein n=1 Tax=Lithospermum erythrorhizon TaxID=34254 RepID=A0AAV3RTW7_LITER